MSYGYGLKTCPKCSHLSPSLSPVGPLSCLSWGAAAPFSSSPAPPFQHYSLDGSDVTQITWLLVTFRIKPELGAVTPASARPGPSLPPAEPVGHLGCPRALPPPVQSSETTGSVLLRFLPIPGISSQALPDTDGLFLPSLSRWRSPLPPGQSRAPLHLPPTDRIPCCFLGSCTTLGTHRCVPLRPHRPWDLAAAQSG